MKHQYVPTPLAALPAPGYVVQVPIELLMPDPAQPRTDFDDTALAALAADIKIRGIENPIRIRSDYVIKHGERRWRAAKQAGLKEVPCLLADPAADDNPAVEWKLDQLADNPQQAALTPMDWARFLRKLVDENGVAVKALPALLERRGLKLSRPYLSNLMRLTELPAWAQALVTTGRLNQAHGKALLTAKVSERVQQRLEKQIAELLKDIDESGDRGSVTAREIVELVADTFHEVHIRLDRGYGENAPRFNIKTCEDCSNRHELPTEIGRCYFCLNEKCFGEKQAKADARAERKQAASEDTSKPGKPNKRPLKVKENAAGIVKTRGLSYGRYRPLESADFDTAGCEGCEHRRLGEHDGDKEFAAPTCFNMGCWDDKTRAWQKGRSKRERLAAYVDEWCIARLTMQLGGNYELQYQVLAWMALGCPTNTGQTYEIDKALRKERWDELPKLKYDCIETVAQSHEAGAFDASQVAASGLRVLARDRGHLYRFAKRAGVTLDPSTFAIDKDYLELKSKAELIEILSDKPIEGEPIREDALTKWKREELLKAALADAVVTAVGVPAELADIWTRTEPEPQADDLSPYGLEDDEEIEDEEDLDEGDDSEDTPIEETEED